MLNKYKEAYINMLNKAHDKKRLPIVEDMSVGNIGPAGEMGAAGVSDNPDLKFNVMNVGRKNVIGLTARRGGKGGLVGQCTCKKKKDNCKKCMKQAQVTLVNCLQSKYKVAITENEEDIFLELTSIDPESGEADAEVQELTEYNDGKKDFTENELDYLISLVDLQKKNANENNYYEDDDILNSMKRKLELMLEKYR